MPTSDSGIDTIEEVLEALDTIIARALEEGSRVGYFAAVYRKVTAKIAEGIATGFFDDGERMERLDVTFADRYLSSLSRYQSGGMATKSWELALQATAASRPIMLQHLLVGDQRPHQLGPRDRRGRDRARPGLARSAPGLRPDQRDHRLAHHPCRARHRRGLALDRAARSDRRSTRRRDRSLQHRGCPDRGVALRCGLVPLARDDWAGPIGARDARVAHLARRVPKPGWLSAGLLVIRARESTDVRRNIEALSRVMGPDLRLVEARVRQEGAPTQ